MYLLLFLCSFRQLGLTHNEGRFRVELVIDVLNCHLNIKCMNLLYVNYLFPFVIHLHAAILIEKCLPQSYKLVRV